MRYPATCEEVKPIGTGQAWQWPQAGTPLTCSLQGAHPKLWEKLVVVDAPATH
jgi:hypothetical protein